MESELFRTFGFVPVARNETWVRTGPEAATVALAGVVAALEVTRTLVLSVVFRRDPAAPGAPAASASGDRTAGGRVGGSA